MNVSMNKCSGGRIDYHSWDAWYIRQEYDCVVAGKNVPIRTFIRGTDSTVDDYMITILH